jgi:hypothetical protein
MAGERFSQQLDGLRFDMGSICETIVTTVNGDGAPNAAPMGVTRGGPETLDLKPFKTSTTYENLLDNPRACINITDDPTIFLSTAFKGEIEGSQDFNIDEDLRLEASDASVFVRVVDVWDLSENRTCFTCEVSGIEIHRPTPQVFSRGRAEAIEAIVHATRIQVFAFSEDEETVERLIKRFDECKVVVNRVSPPGSAEAKVISELEKLIGEWRNWPSK